MNKSITILSIKFLDILHSHSFKFFHYYTYFFGYRFQLEMATISSEYQLQLESDISMLGTLDVMVSINSNTNWTQILFEQDGSIVWIQNVEINGVVVGSDEVLSQFSEG